ATTPPDAPDAVAVGARRDRARVGRRARGRPRPGPPAGRARTLTVVDEPPRPPRLAPLVLALRLGVLLWVGRAAGGGGGSASSRPSLRPPARRPRVSAPRARAPPATGAAAVTAAGTRPRSHSSRISPTTIPAPKRRATAPRSPNAVPRPAAPTAGALP